MLCTGSASLAAGLSQTFHHVASIRKPGQRIGSRSDIQLPRRPHAKAIAKVQHREHSKQEEPDQHGADQQGLLTLQGQVSNLGLCSEQLDLLFTLFALHRQAHFFDSGSHLVRTDLEAQPGHLLLVLQRRQVILARLGDRDLERADLDRDAKLFRCSRLFSLIEQVRGLIMVTERQA